MRWKNESEGRRETGKVERLREMKGGMEERQKDGRMVAWMKGWEERERVMEGGKDERKACAET